MSNPIPTKRGRYKAHTPRLLTLDDLDKRSKAASLAYQTRDDLLAELGGVDNVSTQKKLLIDSAALVTAILNDKATAYLNGADIDTSDLSTLVNTQSRTLRDIGLDRVPSVRNITPKADPVELEALIASFRTEDTQVDDQGEGDE